MGFAPVIRHAQRPGEKSPTVSIQISLMFAHGYATDLPPGRADFRSVL